MLIKDLIEKLEQLRERDLKYFPDMGEPEIHIDVFTQIENTDKFHYAGVYGEIILDRSADYVYNIMRAFAPDD